VLKRRKRGRGCALSLNPVTLEGIAYLFEICKGKNRICKIDDFKVLILFGEIINDE